MMVTSGCTTTTTSTNDGGTSTTDSGTDSAADSATDDASTDDGGSDAGACLGDNGSEPYCGPTGEGNDDAGADAAAPVCQFECSTAKTNFKKEVANAINECLNKGDGGACDTSLKPCVEEALPKACDDATAKTFCEPLVAKCGDAGAEAFTQTQCEAVAKALNTTGRESFTFCLTEGGDQCLVDAKTCIDQLTQ